MPPMSICVRLFLFPFAFLAGLCRMEKEPRSPLQQTRQSWSGWGSAITTSTLKRSTSQKWLRSWTADRSSTWTFVMLHWRILGCYARAGSGCKAFELVEFSIRINSWASKMLFVRLCMNDDSWFQIKPTIGWMRPTSYAMLSESHIM